MINQVNFTIMKNIFKQLFVILSFVLLGTGQMWGAVVSGTTYNFSSSTTPSGWSTSYGDTKAGYVVLYKPNYICSEAFFQKSITSIKLNIRSYGGTTTEGTATITWVDSSTGTETLLGTLTPDGTSLADKTLSSFTNTPTANTTGYIKVTCVGGNSSSKGGGIAAITITYTECASKIGVHISSVSNGSASSDLDEACPGQTVTITVKPNANYAFDPNSEYSYAFYWDANGDAAYPAFNESFFTRVGPDTYSFTMPEVDTESYEWLGTDVEIDIHCDVVAVNSLPSRSVTWHVPSGCVTTPADGTSTTAKVFPKPTPLVEEYKFEGWVTAEISGTQSSRPSSVYGAGEAIPANGTYYALYSQVSSVFALVDNLTPGKNYMLCSAYNSSSGAVMSNEFNNAGTALVAESWTISDYSTAPKMTCTDYSCIWQITEIGSTGKYSVYNEEKGQYAQFTGTNNQITLVNTTSDSKAKWTYETGSSHTSKLYTIVSSTKYYICQGGSSNPYAARSTLSNMYLFEQQTVSASYTTNPSTCVTNYTVTYNAGGGTGTVTDSNNPYNAGDEVTVLSNGFTKTDYNFTHWTANVDVVNYSTSATITEGSAIAPGTHITMPSSDVVLTANWEAKEYLYGSSCTPLTNITITYSDNGNTTDVEYGVGTTVAVDSRTGTHGCAEWTFVGWQRGSAVANNSTSYTPTHNFTAAAGDDGVTFYAVYEKVNTDWISAFDGSELKSGATYVIVKAQADNNHRALSTTVASTNYLAGTQLATDCDTVKDAYNNNRYKLTVTPTADFKWEASYVNSSWRLYNKALGKYIKLSSSDASLILTTACEDAFSITPATHGIYDNDSELHLQSGSNSKYLGWYNSGPYWHGNASSRSLYMCTNSNSFTSTPDCGLRTVTFHGNGGTVIASGGSPTGANLGITETVRDEPITTPTATFADCNGKSWSFVGWSDHEIDVTRVPVLTTDLLNDGGGNKSHTVTASDEEYWAVFTNPGTPETKYGTINIVPADVTGEYRDELTFTKNVTSMGDYTFAYYHVGDQSSLGIQFDYANATKGYLKNTTSLGKINSISFSTFGTGSISDVQVYVGNSADACNTLLTAAELQTVSGVSTYYPKNNYAYVKIQASAYVGIGTISIDFGKPTQVWATTPDCSTITLTGTPRITSYAGKTVKGVTALTVNAKQLAGTPLSFAAYNVADDTPNSHFGFVGSVSALTDGTVTDQTIIVTYTPAGDATTDGIEEVYFKATALADDNVTTTESNKQSGYGRHLPTKFVIATKVGDKWYGMPNNIATTSYGTRALIPIVVNDATSPTTATVYTSTTDYLAWNMNCAGTGTARYASDGEKIAFTSPINANKALMGSSTGIKNSAALPSPITLEYLWKPETSDLGNYTLLNGDASTYYIATDGSVNWSTSTTGANVRFLIIDEQPAPDITWYNDMLGENHTTNTAENGVVTLPTGADPVSCNATLLPTFCGWKDGAIATYVTSAPTYVQAGDAATTDKKYYAVFKHATLDRWYTDCPTIYTITYTANGGTGSDHLEYTMNTTADAITVGAAGFSKEGCTFIGWTNPDDVDGTIITPGAGKITGLSGDITLNAVWIGTTTITGTVRLTTAAGEKVATSGTEVTISSTDFACATALRITYKDVTNDVTYGRSGTPSYTSSEFRLCNGSYGSADGGNISLAEVSGAYNQTFSITYEPNGGANTLDHYQLKVEVLLKNTVIETKTLDLYGRTLPAVFAIATKIGGAWYALPNDMSASGTYDPILISVTENANVLSWTAQGPANTAYIMRDYTVNYSRLRFAANDANQYCLWAADGNAAGIRNYSATSTDAAYGWIVTETNADFSGYTMATSNNTRTGLMISNNKWGMANSGNSEIHFIPLTTVETIDIIAREWKTNGLVFAIDADNNISTTSGHTQYGIDAAPSTNVTSITRHSTGGYGLYEVGLADITGDYGKVLSLKMKVGGVDKIANVTIPIIVSGTTTTTTAATPFTALDAATKDYDVVILDGAKLTTNATASHASSFHNFYVYSGGTWINDNGSTSLNYLELRGGIKGIGAKDSHVQGVPHVMLNKNVTSTNGANLDMTVYTDHGYALSVPFDVALSTVNFANSLKPGTGAQVNGTLASQFWIRKYDGEVRANNGRGGWVDITPADNKTIHAGEGYTLQGKRPKGQPFAVIRFPFSGVASWANASGEVAKADIPIYAYEGGANTPDNDKGWNLIANPYMATIAYNTEDELSWAASFKVGNLEKTDGANWDGKYQWTDASHAYVTIPNDSYTAFPQTRASKATFYPFKNFFIQASSNGVVAFVRTDRSEIQQRLMAQEEQMAPIFADINLAHGSESAQAGLTIDAGATAGYKFGEDYTIFESREELDYLKVYTIADGHYLVGNTLTPAETTEMIPLEFYAPNTTGEYVFSLDEGSDIDRLEYVILYDAELGLNTNLLIGSYAVELDKTGLIENRFSIGLKIKEEEHVTTGTGDVDGEAERPFKFIHNDKMYILRNGKLYDATGKMVREINK